MYYNDVHLTDLGSNVKSSHWSFGQLIFLAKEKQQPLSDKGSLGLDYDFTEVGTHACIHFWVRGRLETKVLYDARSTCNTCSDAFPGFAVITVNFLQSGVFGHVGCGGLQPLKDHHYGCSSVLSDRLTKCFEVFATVATSSAIYDQGSLRRSCAFVASDAALGAPRQGSELADLVRRLLQAYQRTSMAIGSETTRLPSWRCK